LAEAAAQGKPGRIVAKMNALTDEALMLALVRAGQKGAKVDLIVRGACMLPAQVPGITDNIRVRSIIGRFLEHSRVFYFRSGHGRRPVPGQRRLDEPQHAAPHRAGLAGDRPGLAPAHH
jgi:polyphosphate kinase